MQSIHLAYWQPTSTDSVSQIVHAEQLVFLPPVANMISLVGWPTPVSNIIYSFFLQGYRTLLSSPWYLNLGQYYGDDWAQYYAVEPLAFKVSFQHCTADDPCLSMASTSCSCLLLSLLSLICMPVTQCESPGSFVNLVCLLSKCACLH